MTPFKHYVERRKRGMSHCNVHWHSAHHSSSSPHSVHPPHLAHSSHSPHSPHPPHPPPSRTSNFEHLTHLTHPTTCALTSMQACGTALIRLRLLRVGFVGWPCPLLLLPFAFPLLLLLCLRLFFLLLQLLRMMTVTMMTQVKRMDLKRKAHGLVVLDVDTSGSGVEVAATAATLHGGCLRTGTVSFGPVTSAFCSRT